MQFPKTPLETVINKSSLTESHRMDHLTMSVVIVPLEKF